MKQVIEESLSRSVSYDEYRKIIAISLEGQKLDGAPPEDMIHYTLLNETRMNRLEKTIKIIDEVQKALNLLPHKYLWLVLSEGWCGDAAQILPILHKMELASEKITMKILFRDENEPLMNLFLTNGSMSIPKLIILDPQSHDVLADWGPRPNGAAQLIQRYKAEKGVVDEEAVNDLQLWYLRDKGISTQQEIVALLQKIIFHL